MPLRVAPAAPSVLLWYLVLRGLDAPTRHPAHSCLRPPPRCLAKGRSRCANRAARCSLWLPSEPGRLPPTTALGQPGLAPRRASTAATPKLCVCMCAGWVTATKGARNGAGRWLAEAPAVFMTIGVDAPTLDATCAAFFDDWRVRCPRRPPLPPSLGVQWCAQRCACAGPAHLLPTCSLMCCWREHVTHEHHCACVPAACNPAHSVTPDPTTHYTDHVLCVPFPSPHTRAHRRTPCWHSAAAAAHVQ